MGLAHSIQGTSTGDQILSPVLCATRRTSNVIRTRLQKSLTGQTQEGWRKEERKPPSAVGCSHESVCARAWGSLLPLLTCCHTKLKWLSWIQHLLIISEHKCGMEWRHSIASSSAGRTLPCSSPSAQHDSTSAGHAERRNNMRHKGAMLTEAGGYGKGELKAHEKRGERRKEKLG